MNNEVIVTLPDGRRVRSWKGGVEALSDQDPLKAARLRMRKHGAWAGSYWICKCPSMRHVESKRECGNCGRRTPPNGVWMKQSTLYAHLAGDELMHTAVKYMERATVSIIAREGLDSWNAAYPHLLAQIAYDYHVDVDTLESHWKGKS